MSTYVGNIPCITGVYFGSSHRGGPWKQRHFRLRPPWCLGSARRGLSAGGTGATLVVVVVVIVVSFLCSFVVLFGAFVVFAVFLFYCFFYHCVWFICCYGFVGFTCVCFNQGVYIYINVTIHIHIYIHKLCLIYGYGSTLGTHWDTNGPTKGSFCVGA